MKKSIALFLAIILVLTVFTGCQTTTTKETKTSLVACDFLTLADEFFTTLQKNSEKRFGDEGIKVEFASCDMDATKQLNQIENFATMGATHIILYPVDVDSLAERLKNYRQQGIEIYFLGVSPTDLDVCDGVMTVDQAALGDYAAKEAADWIDKTFPDAKDGSIEVGLIINTQAGGSLKARCDALNNVEKYTKKAKIVETDDVVGETNPGAKSQEFVDGMFLTHPNIKVILSATQASGLAANEAIMRMSGLDFSKIGVFSCDFDPSMGAKIAESANNESVLRCGVTFGDASVLMLAAVKGELEINEKKEAYLSTDVVTLENLSVYYTP